MCCDYPVLVMLCLIGSRVSPPVDVLMDELGLSFTCLVGDRGDNANIPDGPR